MWSEEVLKILNRSKIREVGEVFVVEMEHEVDAVVCW